MTIKAVLCDLDGVIRHWDGDPVAAAELGMTAVLYRSFDDLNGVLG